MQRMKIIIIGMFLITNSYVFCQNHLEFIPKNNEKTLSFKQGDHIGYTKKGFSFIKNGELETITDSTITVSGKTIHISDIKFIGHRKKGTGLVAIGTAAVAGFALGYFTAPETNSNTEKVVGLSIAIPVFTLGAIVNYKNRLYNVRKKYTFKVTS